MLRAVSFDMSGQALVTACQNGPWSEVESNPQWPCVARSRTRPVTDCCVTPPCRPSSGMLCRSQYDRCLPKPFTFTSHPIIPHQSRSEAIANHATAVGGGDGFVPNVLYINSYVLSALCDHGYSWVEPRKCTRLKIVIRRPWSIPTASSGNQPH